MIPRQNFGGTWIDLAGDAYVRAQGNQLFVGRIGADGKGHDTGFYVCPEPPMFHRCAAAPDGTIAVFAKGNATGAALFASPLGVLVIGTTNGNNPGAIYWNGHEFQCVWTEFVGEFSFWGSVNGRMGSFPIPAPWTDTSQGILDLDANGYPMWMDQYRTYNQSPWSFTKPNVRSDVRVGQWGYPGKDHPELNRIIVGVNGIVFTGILDTADDPRVSVVGSRIIAAAYTPQGASLQVIDAPYPPNEQPPPPAPDPGPTPPKPDPPKPDPPKPDPPKPIPPDPPKPIPVTKGDFLMFSIFADPTKQLLAVKGPKAVSNGGTVLENLDGTIVSIQPDGRVETRPSGADGGYERCTVNGNVATWKPGDKYYTFGWVVAAGL